MDFLSERYTPSENTAEKEPKAGLRAYTADHGTMIFNSDHC